MCPHMKKITLILLAVFFCQITLANETDSILSKARNLVHDKNYTEAIKVYKSYIEKNYENEIKDVYVELANCYFNSNDKKSAIKYIKEAITKQGFTEEDFIYNDKLDAELSKYALSKIYDDLEKLQKQYVSR